MSTKPSRYLTKRLTALLQVQERALRLSGADPVLLSAFERLITHVKSDGPSFLSPVEEPAKRIAPDMSESEMKGLTSGDVEQLLTIDQSRAMLEALANARFGMPKGSMRQWPSKPDLIEKMRTMLRNERVHRTIKEVATAPRKGGTS